MRTVGLLAASLLLVLLPLLPAHAGPQSWQFHSLDGQGPGGAARIAMGVSEDARFFIGVGTEEGSGERFITFGGRDVAISPAHDVVFRIDEGAPFRFAGPMTDGPAEFTLNEKGNVISLHGGTNKHRKLLKGLRTGSRATVRFQDASGSKRSAAVPLEGSAEAIGKVLR